MTVKPVGQKRKSPSQLSWKAFQGSFFSCLTVKNQTHQFQCWFSKEMHIPCWLSFYDIISTFLGSIPVQHEAGEPHVPSDFCGHTSSSLPACDCETELLLANMCCHLPRSPGQQQSNINPLVRKLSCTRLCITEGDPWLRGMTFSLGLIPFTGTVNYKYWHKIRPPAVVSRSQKYSHLSMEKEAQW